MAAPSRRPSPGEGKGSTFTVRLPVRAVRMREENEERTPSTTAPRFAATPSTSRTRLPLVRTRRRARLVVDDEADARRSW